MNVPADHVVNRRRGTPVGNVREIDAGHRGEQRGGDVRGAADAGRGVVELARPGLGKRDELLDRACRNRRVDDEQIPVCPVGLRDRGEVGHGVVRQLLEEGRVCPMRTVGEQERVAIRRRLGRDRRVWGGIRAEGTGVG